MQRLAAAILAEHAQVQKRLSAVQKAWPQAAEDVRQQCARLLLPGFLARTPWPRLQHLPRYLKAAALRLDKLRVDPARDAQRAAELAPLEQAYRRELASRAKLGGAANAGQGGTRAAAELEQFGWLLEELRVSLFAQELKTPVPVSAKRLAKLWHSIKR
jgi:ATP-dependent helicase HrpA